MISHQVSIFSHYFIFAIVVRWLASYIRMSYFSLLHAYSSKVYSWKYIMERKVGVQRKELHLVKCRYLFQPEEDDHSTYSKGTITNQKHHIKELLDKSRKRPRE